MSPRMGLPVKNAMRDARVKVRRDKGASCWRSRTRGSRWRSRAMKHELRELGVRHFFDR